MSNIGKWGKRKAYGYLYHKIESEIAERVVTNCGRQMNLIDKKKKEMIFEEIKPSKYLCCYACGE